MPILRTHFVGLLMILLLAVAPTHGEDRDAGFKDLFNGKDLSGWDGDEEFWSVQDGAITGRTTAEHPAKHNTFLILKDAKPRDFELHVTFKIDSAGWGGN